MKCPQCGILINEHEISRLQYLDDMHDVADLMPGRAERLGEIFKVLGGVVVAAQFAKYMAASSLDTALNKQLDKLRVALDEVPDWISEDN